MAFAIFVVDVYCLGIKDVIVKFYARDLYEQCRAKYEDSNPMIPIEPEVARKLVEGAVQYAHALGFRRIALITRRTLSSATSTPALAPSGLNSAMKASRCLSPARTTIRQSAGTSSRFYRSAVDRTASRRWSRQKSVWEIFYRQVDLFRLKAYAAEPFRRGRVCTAMMRQTRTIGNLARTPSFAVALVTAAPLADSSAPQLAARDRACWPLTQD